MERYDNLDLDLECDDGGGGSVAQKAAIFGGMFKRSSKIAEPSAQAQDTLSVNSDLSKSSDSLTDNSTKEKGGVFKGMFKKTTKTAKEGQSQDTLSLQNSELSVSSDSLTDNKSSKEKSGVFGGILKRTAKPGHVRRPSQDLLDNDFTASNDSLSENTATKETGGVFSGMFKKKPFGARTQSQEDLSAPSELSGSTDNLSVNSNTKETGGMFSGMFKKSPKPFRAMTQSQEDLSAPSELSGSTDNLSVNSNTKEAGGIFSGMFKKKPLGARTQSQDDLAAPSELSGSTDNLSESKDTKEKGGIFSGVFRKKVTKSQSQDDLFADGELSASSDSLVETSSKEKGKTEHSGDSKENTEKPKAKQNGFSAMMRSTFYTDKQEKNSDSDSEEILDNGEGQPSHKQNKLTEAMTKLNPFRSANKHEKQAGSDDEDPRASSEKSSGNKQKDTEDTEKLTEDEKLMEGNPKAVKSNMIQRERKDRSETPTVPPRPTEEEMKSTSTYNKGKPIGAEDNKDNKDMTSREKKAKLEKSPVVPARPSEEELKRAERRDQQKQKSNHQNQSDDEGLQKDESTESKDESNTTKVKKHKHNPFMPRVAAKASSDDEGLKEDDDSSSKEEKKDEDGKDKAEETKVKKPKRHNPFMPRVKASSDDEGLKEEDDSSSKEEKKDEEGEDKTETKVKKPKRHNPFMPRVKGRVKAKVEDGAAGNTAENGGPQRTLFDQLEDYRIDPAQSEEGQDVEDLMEWWNTVESWEDTAQEDDMTEKEEAKAFAVTAEKVQKGIRVFNKLFSERAESLWQHVIDLNSIADGLDKFSKKTKIAQITGGSTSAIGGVATIAGLALAPVTMGTSLIVTAVGLGVATAGGLTSAGAGISNQVNNSMDRKKVEKIIKDYQEKMVDLNKCLKFIKQGIENLKKFDLLKMKDNAYNRDFPVLTAQFYEDGAMAGKAILINANEIMRVVQIANVAGSTAARAVQIASMATGVLTGLFVGMDIYFVAKDSKELKKGAKSEFAGKIREVATQLHDGLVELNGIREELQCTAPQNEDAGDDTAALDSDKKEKDDKYDSSEEDEIDRIKKAIKKDIESREYV